MDRFTIFIRDGVVYDSRDFTPDEIIKDFDNETEMNDYLDYMLDNGMMDGDFNFIGY